MNVTEKKRLAIIVAEKESALRRLKTLAAPPIVLDSTRRLLKEKMKILHMEDGLYLMPWARVYISVLKKREEILSTTGISRFRDDMEREVWKHIPEDLSGEEDCLESPFGTELLVLISRGESIYDICLQKIVETAGALPSEKQVEIFDAVHRIVSEILHNMEYVNDFPSVLPRAPEESEYKRA